MSLYSDSTHLSSSCTVCADRCDRTCVPIKLDGQAWLCAVSLTLESQALLTTNQKLVNIVVEERHTSHCYRAGLPVLKIKTLLRGRINSQR